MSIDEFRFRGTTLVLTLSLFACTVHRDIGSPLVPPAPDALGSATDGTASGNAVTFRLSYQYLSGIDACHDQLFVQSVGDGNVQAYVQVIDPAGQQVPIVPDCASCFCSEAAPTVSCGGSPPAVTELHYGDHVDWIWDGSTKPLIVCGDRTCQGDGTAAPGPYLARFCHATTADGAGAGHHVTAPTCDDVPFDYPAPGALVTDTVTCYAP
jgi:hypothetical protein